MIGLFNWNHQLDLAMLRGESISSYVEQSKWVIILATIGGLLVLRFVQRKRRHQFPPGPKRVPFLGNAFNFPKDRWCEAFSQWKDEYGTFRSL
jgi:hypothetical protein